MKKKIILVIILIMSLLFIGTWITIFRIDAIRASKLLKPIMIFNITHYDTVNGSINEYYSLGYKIVEYNFPSGRKAFEIGPWIMKLNTDLLEMKVNDFIDDFNDNYRNYEHKYLKLDGYVEEVKGRTELSFAYSLEFKKEDGTKYIDFDESLIIKCVFDKEILELDNIHLYTWASVTGRVSKIERINAYEQEILIEHCNLVEYYENHLNK